MNSLNSCNEEDLLCCDEIPAFKYYLDWDMIVGSIAKQYHIFIYEMTSDDDLSWETFENLVANLDDSTIFGKVVSCRLENDSERIKNFTPKQKQIWIEWQEQIPIEVRDRIQEQKLNKLNF